MKHRVQLNLSVQVELSIEIVGQQAWKKEKERGIFNGEIIKIYYLWKCG